jgi:hypothetical protein
MKPSATQALTLLAASLLFFTGRASLGADSPSADEIMRMARLNPMSQQAKLAGKIENEDGKTPFTLSLQNGVVSYDFQNPDQEIQLVLREDGSELRERLDGKPVKPARYDQKVRGTAITYEDLALNLLYWPKPKIVDEETIRLVKCWVIEVQAPRGQSQYGVARLWIDQKSGAVIRIIGYDMKGLKKKGFEMISGQKIDGRWMLKTMRVDTYDPATQKPIDDERTQLTILGDAK